MNFSPSLDVAHASSAVADLAGAAPTALIDFNVDGLLSSFWALTVPG